MQILDAVLDETIKVPYFQGGHYLSTLKDLAATVIESNNTPGEMDYMLRKSKNCALNLVHHWDMYSAETDFLAFASLNMRRCSSLSIHVCSSSEADPLLKSSAPILREAIVDAVIPFVDEPDVLFNGQAGRLEDLRFRNIPVWWDSGLPPSLRRIRIAHKWSHATWLPHPRTFVSALSSCAGLEVVELSGQTSMFRPRQWADLDAQGPIVELPMLKELKIEDIPIAGVFYIIGHINSLTLQKLESREFCQAEPVAHLLQSPCPLLLESIRRALASRERLWFTIGHNHVFLTIPGAGEYVDLNIYCTDPDGLGHWFVEEFVSELSSISELKLAVGAAYKESEPQVLQKLLEAVNNVARLHCPYLNGVAT